MGIEHMRGNYGRCPPFLFGGLVLICLIITVNWWSLSTQNTDLLRQLEDLGEKFKLSSDQREQCLQLRMVLDNRLKNTEEELAQVRVRLEKMKIEMNKMKTEESQKDEEIKTLQKNAGDAQNAASMCGSELESLKKLDISKDGTIASLRIEKDKYSNKIDEKDQEIKKLQSELDQAKQEVNALKMDMEASKVSIPQEPVQRRQLEKQPLVDVLPKGMEGMIFHEGNIIVLDPPNAPRPRPLYSVTYLKGNQGGELDDNHGGEREDVDDTLPLPERKNKEVTGKKLSTRKPLPTNEENAVGHGNILKLTNTNTDDKREDNKIDPIVGNDQIKQPESPPVGTS